MSKLFKLFKREITYLVKDHTLVLTLLIAPLLYAFFYGSIYLNKSEKEVKIAVVDADQSDLSHKMIHQIDLLPIADVIAYSDIHQAQEAMYRGEVQGFLIVEKGLENTVFSLKQATITLTINASRFLPSSDLTSAITKVVLTTSGAVRLNYFQKHGEGSKIALLDANPVHLNHKSLYNETLSYGDFLLPGLLALILQQTLLIGLSESMAGEREKKTVHQLLAISNKSFSTILWGKGSFYFLLYCGYALFIMTVNYSMLSLPFRGNKLDAALLIGLFILTLIPMGLWIGTLFKKQLLAMQVMAFTTYPFFLISGYSMPFEALPKVVQYIANFAPTTPFLKAYISITQMGGSLIENSTSVVHLLVLWCVFTFLFIVKMKKLSQNEAINSSDSLD